MTAVNKIARYLATFAVLLCLMPAVSQASELKDSTIRNGGISIRTNLLWLGTGSANIGMEQPVSGKWTIGANAALKSWPRFFPWDSGTKEAPKQWKHITIAPEVRFYPAGVYNGWFFGGDLIYSHYNAANIDFGLFKDLKQERHQGDFYGAGLFAGHSWWLSDHWRIEAEAGLGAGYKNAKTYECAHCGAELGKTTGLQLVPKVGVNLAWNLNKRTRARKEVIDVITDIIPVVPEQPKEEETNEEETKPEVKEEVVPVVPEVVEPVKSVAEELAPTHPILRPSSEYVPYNRDMVIRKMEGAMYVYYEFSKAQVKRSVKTPAGVRENGPVLDEIIEVTKQILADSLSSVSKVQIVGLTSFEGGRWGNERLSEARAKALKDYVQGQLDIPDSAFEVVGGGEAWTDLRDQLAEMLEAGGGAGLTVKQLQKAIDIIDKEKDPDRREALLKEADGGVIYSKIRRGVFADQRSAGYLRIFYDIEKK